MVGFSLSHGFGAFLFVFPILLELWIAVVATVTIRSFIKKERVAIQRWIGLGSMVLLLSFTLLPVGFWQRVFIGRMAASPRAGDLLVYAAYRGDLGTVKGFLSHGVPINATDRANWRTALHASAQQGDLRITRYLLSKRANVNALDRAGDSPLELAASKGNDQVERLLIASGAVRVAGNEAQHQKAIHDQVRESIEELDRAAPR